MRIGATAGAALAAMAMAAAILAGSGTSWAAEGEGGTAVGSGTVPGFSFGFDVEQRSADTRDASGSFRALGMPPSDLLIEAQGPAICVDVRDNMVGFLYPLREGSRPEATQGQNILITAVDNGPGETDSLGFLPVGIDPGSCAPNPATLPLTSGDIVVEEN